MADRNRVWGFVAIDWRRFAGVLRGEKVRGEGSRTPDQVVDDLKARYPDTSSWSSAPVVDRARQRMDTYDERWSKHAGDRRIRLRRTRIGRGGSGVTVEADLVACAAGVEATGDLRIDGRAWYSLAFALVAIALGVLALFLHRYLGLLFLVLGPFFVLQTARTTLADADQVWFDLGQAIGSPLVRAREQTAPPGGPGG
jgi:hypothetical protein